MLYDFGKGENKNWIIVEDNFDERYLGKCESIMCQGNGYLAVRASTEENYVGNVRDMFISGTFNKFEDEVTELPNVSDIIAMDIIINNEKLNLATGKIDEYSRMLNLKNGLMERSFIWTSVKGDKVKFLFKRIVSLFEKNLVCQKVEITPLSNDIDIVINSGINGQVSNTGSQHFTEVEKRLLDKLYLQNVMKTTTSKIDFVVNTTHSFTLNDKEFTPNDLIRIERRKIYMKYDANIKKDETLTISKVSNVNTSRDKENENKTIDELRKTSIDQIEAARKISFENHLEKTSQKWQELWNEKDIKIQSTNDYDQLALRFAIYHLTVMTPIHDDRMNIGAKGMSGEGYKGHTFWDTEIFMLPHFILADPIGAKSLCTYRYKNLVGARAKAKENGCQGAMYPWETAWIEDGEVTPLWGDANVVTGEAQKIWTGLIELHITSDVAYGIYNYYTCTQDEEFMDNYGYEIILDTANFWQSRLEYNESLDRYEINNVIGPDEYKEHVNNNAYTNYMAHWNIKLAMSYCELIKKEKPEVYNRINKIINLDEIYEKWVEKVDKIYTPKMNKDNIIPQDDTYLSYPIIDLTKYKKSDKIGTINLDYSMEQISKLQVSKQADVLVLFLIMEDLFSEQVKKDNFYYYEERCMHDSSLSLSTHSVLASDLKIEDKAYELFQRACNIDLGPVMTTSDAGIHAASFGGIWQCIVYGFAGVRVVHGKLRIEPNLPKNWDNVEFNIYWKGTKLNIKVTNEKLIVKNANNGNEVCFNNNGKEIIVKDMIEISYK